MPLCQQQRTHRDIIHQTAFSHLSFLPPPLIYLALRRTSSSNPPMSYHPPRALRERNTNEGQKSKIHSFLYDYVTWASFSSITSSPLPLCYLTAHSVTHSNPRLYIIHPTSNMLCPFASPSYFCPTCYTFPSSFRRWFHSPAPPRPLAILARFGRMETPNPT